MSNQPMSGGTAGRESTAKEDTSPGLKPEDMGMGNSPFDSADPNNGAGREPAKEPVKAVAKPAATPARTPAARNSTRRSRAAQPRDLPVAANTDRSSQTQLSADGEEKIWPHRPETVPPSAM